MTREEAINFLKGYLDEEVYTEKCRNVHNMAIKALEQKPILEKIKEVVCKWKADNFTDGYAWDCMKEIADIVDKAESEEEYDNI